MNKLNKMDIEAAKERNIFKKARGKLKISPNVRNYCREFCNNTSIHGIHYFGEEKRTIYEKIWWITAIAFSCTFCFILITKTYKQWEKSPVIMTFATTEKPIWQIPFPAVTICPEVKSYRSFFKYTQLLHKKEDNKTLTKDEETYFNYMSLICRHRPYLNFTEDFIEDDDIYDFLDNVTSKTSNQFFNIRFMGKKKAFSKVFMPIFTDEGICYTFNMLNREDMFTDVVKHYKNYHNSNFSKSGWNLEKGYNIDATKNAYPKRALFSGTALGLDLGFMGFALSPDYTCTNGGFQGYKILIHHPAKLPIMRHHHFRISHEQSITAAITPKMIQTSEEVKSYSPQKRGCHFPSERHLHFFKFYTQTNCKIECLSNFTLKMCNCVSFYMPHDKETLICGAANTACTIDAENYLLNNFITTKLDLLKHGQKLPIREKYSDYCDCLPVCTSISYSTEILQNAWEWKKSLQAERIVLPNETIFTNIFRPAQLNIYFKTSQFIPSERRELYSPTDLLANFGGLLGLFTGFSLLSLIEIVYFLSLRIYCNIKLYGNRFGSGTSKK